MTKKKGFILSRKFQIRKSRHFWNVNFRFITKNNAFDFSNSLNGIVNALIWYLKRSVDPNIIRGVICLQSIRSRCLICSVKTKDFDSRDSKIQLNLLFCWILFYPKSVFAVLERRKPKADETLFQTETDLIEPLPSTSEFLNDSPGNIVQNLRNFGQCSKGLGQIKTRQVRFNTQLYADNWFWIK